MDEDIKKLFDSEPIPHYEIFKRIVFGERKTEYNSANHFLSVVANKINKIYREYMPFISQRVFYFETFAYVEKLQRNEHIIEDMFNNYIEMLIAGELRANLKIILPLIKTIPAQRFELGRYSEAWKKFSQNPQI